MATYKEKLLDPKWQKKRLQIFERDGFCCLICGGSETTLHLHHKAYLPSTEPWDYPDHLLATLCADCHESETHELKQLIPRLLLAIRGKYFAFDIEAIVEGFEANNQKARFDEGDAIKVFLISIKP